MHVDRCMQSCSVVGPINGRQNSSSVPAGVFWQVYAQLFSDGTPERMDQLFRYLDKDHTGCIDYLSWSRRIRLQVLQHDCISFIAALSLPVG